MDRRSFLSSVASSPLLNVLSFDRLRLEETDDVEYGVEAESKKHSRRLSKYRRDDDQLDESVEIYHDTAQWFRTVQTEVEKLGFSNHCVFDIKNTSLLYCSYSTGSDCQWVMYEIGSGRSVVTVFEYETHYEVSGEEFESSEEVKEVLEDIAPEKRGDWAL